MLTAGTRMRNEARSCITCSLHAARGRASESGETELEANPPFRHAKRHEQGAEDEENSLVMPLGKGLFTVTKLRLVMYADESRCAKWQRNMAS